MTSCSWAHACIIKVSYLYGVYLHYKVSWFVNGIIKLILDSSRWLSLFSIPSLVIVIKKSLYLFCWLLLKNPVNLSTAVNSLYTTNCLYILMSHLSTGTQCSIKSRNYYAFLKYRLAAIKLRKWVNLCRVFWFNK